MSEKVEVNLYCLAKIVSRLSLVAGDSRLREALGDATATASIDEASFRLISDLLSGQPNLQSREIRRCDPWTEPDCIDWGRV